MTMDRVYNQQPQHGFQQPQQIPTHSHIPQAQQLPLPPHQLSTNLTHSSSQPQHLYRHNHQASILLHHQQHTQPTNPNPPPIPHRPIHPPPPPPPPPSNHQHNNNLTAATTIITSESVSNSRIISTSETVEAPTCTITQKLPTNHSDQSSSLNRNPIQQHNYYVDTYYQHYQPSNLQTHHHHNQQRYQQLHNLEQPQHQQQQQPFHQHYHHQQPQHHTAYSANGSAQVQRQPQPYAQNSCSVTDNGGKNCSDNTGQDEYIDEVIQAILAAKDALDKVIVERDEKDILLIDNLCSYVMHGFDAFPKTVRRALAAHAILIITEGRGKVLIVHEEELDSFCVLIYGECEQLNADKTVSLRQYSVGDTFGVCMPTTETIRFDGHMMTKCEHCAFLCVKRDDFYTILTDPANYPRKDIVKHRDQKGNVVCVSQFNIDKTTSDPLWLHYMQSMNPYKIVLPDGHIIIKATEASLLLALVDGYDGRDPEYIDDFLLLFRVFMTHDQKDKEKNLPPGMLKLCSTLFEWLNHANYRNKVVTIVLLWLSTYYHDFELNPDFSYRFFRVLESKLLKLGMNDQLHLLHVTLSTKSKTREVTITRSSPDQPLTFSISGGYEKNCGIFVTRVDGSNCDESSFESLDCQAPPPAPPRHRINQLSNIIHNQDPGTPALLRPGDQILEVNTYNFTAIERVKAQQILNAGTHLSLTVRYNPSAYHEMRALPDGQRKSSLSSISSVSPYHSSHAQTRFTFNHQDHPMQLTSSSSNNNIRQSETHLQSPSPLFSSNANIGFKNFVKSIPKSERFSDGISSLYNSSKQFFKQTTQSSSNKFETMSKTSDNVSEDQISSDVDFGKAKSNPDLASMRGKDRQIESSLSNIIHSDNLNPACITESNSTNGSNATLVNVLRVFNAANNEFRYLLIHEETTAREVVMVAVKEFNLSGNSPGAHLSPGDKSVSSRDWLLYEVSVVPESKTIKQKRLPEQASRLAEKAALCSRFYIKNNSQSSSCLSRLDMTDDALVNEILKESPPNITLTSLNATLLAVELTLIDFDKFRKIEPQQFVYDTFFNCSEQSRDSASHMTNGGSFSVDSASLKSSSSDGQEVDLLHLINKSRSIPKNWVQEYKEFADISNREMFWVVCEILNERNVGRRVKIIKQFIRVADVCSQLRNFNSMFAIISGLGHSCVNRLRRTFEKLKPKYKNQLEKMRTLFDPSKNMSNYRVCLQQTPPPAIPLFPQIKKDLTFTKEGRSIFIRESNDPSDDEDSCGFSQGTIKRKTRGEMLSVKSSTLDHPPVTPGNNNYPLPTAKTRSVSYCAFKNQQQNSSTIDGGSNILVNFSEIRQFTDRVRGVTHYSSVPYSNDLLTNTKDNQRNQAQIRKMHEEWQMRKRIRHYIDLTLNSAITAPSNNDQSREGRYDQTDSSSSSVTAKKHENGSSSSGGKLTISYDERTLYQRSLEVEPEINTRPPTVSSERSSHQYQHQQHSAAPISNVQLHPPNQPQVPPTVLNMHPPSVSNSSPTLSKSSSLSSCSSFNHHMPNYLLPPRSNLTSSVGKFGTESTESLRKLQALSENVDEWRNYQSNSNNGIANRMANDQTRSKGGLVQPRIFSSKGDRR